MNLNKKEKETLMYCVFSFAVGYLMCMYFPIHSKTNGGYVLEGVDNANDKADNNKADNNKDNNNNNKDNNNKADNNKDNNNKNNNNKDNNNKDNNNKNNKNNKKETFADQVLDFRQNLLNSDYENNL